MAQDLQHPPKLWLILICNNERVCMKHTQIHCLIVVYVPFLNVKPRMYSDCTWCMDRDFFFVCATLVSDPTSIRSTCRAWRPIVPHLFGTASTLARKCCQCWPLVARPHDCLFPLSSTDHHHHNLYKLAHLTVGDSKRFMLSSRKPSCKSIHQTLFIRRVSCKQQRKVLHKGNDTPRTRYEFYNNS